MRVFGKAIQAFRLSGYQLSCNPLARRYSYLICSDYKHSRQRIPLCVQNHAVSRFSGSHSGNSNFFNRNIERPSRGPYDDSGKSHSSASTSIDKPTTTVYKINDIVPVALISTGGHNASSLKILLIPINLFEGDDEAVQKTIATLSVLREHAEQIEAFTGNLTDDSSTEGPKTYTVTTKTLSQFDDLDELTYTKPNVALKGQDRKQDAQSLYEGLEKAMAESAAEQLAQQKEIAQVEPVQAQDSFDVVPWNESKRRIIASLPEPVEEALKNMSISSMELAFEMNMTNIKDALLLNAKAKDLGLDHIKLESPNAPKTLKNPTVSLTATCLDLTPQPEETVPLSFNALIQGTVEVDTSQFSNDDLKVPEFNDNMTAIAANICSTALQKGFPADTGRMTFSTKSKKTGKGENEKRDESLLSSPDDIVMTPFDAHNLMSCDVYSRAVEAASKLRDSLTRSKSNTPTLAQSKNVPLFDVSDQGHEIEIEAEHNIENIEKKPLEIDTSDVALRPFDMCSPPMPPSMKPRPQERTFVSKMSSGSALTTPPQRSKSSCGTKKDKGGPCGDKKKKKDPCGKKKDPCAKKKKDPCAKKKKDPCAKKKKDPCGKKKDPCAKKKKDPCAEKKDSCAKKEDPCGKKEDKCQAPMPKPKCNEDPCKAKKKDTCGSKKKKDPCASKKKKDPCGSKKKKDPCGSKKKDPCGSKKKKDPCGSKKKKDPCGSKKKDPCAKKKDSCASKKKKDPCKKSGNKKKEGTCGGKKKDTKPNCSKMSTATTKPNPKGFMSVQKSGCTGGRVWGDTKPNCPQGFPNNKGSKGNTKKYSTSALSHGVQSRYYSMLLMPRQNKAFKQWRLGSMRFTTISNESVKLLTPSITSNKTLLGTQSRYYSTLMMPRMNKHFESWRLGGLRQYSKKKKSDDDVHKDYLCKIVEIPKPRDRKHIKKPQRPAYCFKRDDAECPKKLCSDGGGGACKKAGLNRKKGQKIMPKNPPTSTGEPITKGRK